MHGKDNRLANRTKAQNMPAFFCSLSAAGTKQA